MISQLSCHIREKARPPSSADDYSCLLLFQAQIPFRVCANRCKQLPRSYFYAGWLWAGMSFLSEESHFAQLWSPMVLWSAVRAEGGSKEAEENPLEHRADRGSDSTFQMADIARRILVRGSTAPPVCETADYFLFLLLLPCLSPFPSPFLKLQTQKKHCFPHTGEIWQILFFLSLHNTASGWAHWLLSFLKSQELFFFYQSHFTLFSFFTPPLSAKHSLHMVMIKPNFLIFGFLVHCPLFTPPTSLPLH